MSYIRAIKVKGHTYYQEVEAYRNAEGKPRVRVVKHLGKEPPAKLVTTPSMDQVLVTTPPSDPVLVTTLPKVQTTKRRGPIRRGYKGAWLTLGKRVELYMPEGYEHRQKEFEKTPLHNQPGTIIKLGRMYAHIEFDQLGKTRKPIPLPMVGNLRPSNAKQECHKQGVDYESIMARGRLSDTESAEVQASIDNYFQSYVDSGTLGDIDLPHKVGRDTLRQMVNDTADRYGVPIRARCGSRRLNITILAEGAACSA